MALLSFCRYPGCHKTVEFGEKYCAEHKNRKRDEGRKDATQRGYVYKWKKAAKAFLRRHPLCVACEAKGIIKAAEVVDHIKPHKGNQTLFWNKKNWQALCKQCHDRKTATEDSYFTDWK